MLVESQQNLKDDLLEAFRDYRDQILERMDKDVAEQESIREEQLFLKHDTADLQDKVTKLENTPKSS